MLLRRGLRNVRVERHEGHFASLGFCQGPDPKFFLRVVERVLFDHWHPPLLLGFPPILAPARKRRTLLRAPKKKRRRKRDDFVHLSRQVLLFWLFLSFATGLFFPPPTTLFDTPLFLSFLRSLPFSLSPPLPRSLRSLPARSPSPSHAQKEEKKQIKIKSKVGTGAAAVGREEIKNNLVKFF